MTDIMRKDSHTDIITSSESSNFSIQYDFTINRVNIDPFYEQNLKSYILILSKEKLEVHAYLKLRAGNDLTTIKVRCY